jgi:hypothetical protein
VRVKLSQFPRRLTLPIHHPGLVPDALYDSQALRGFAGIELNRDPVPDATTLLHFRHWLELHELTKVVFDEVAALLAERGLLMRQGTIVFKTGNGVGNSGLSESDFNRQWGMFRIVIEYDAVKIRHDFNREWVSTAIVEVDPRIGLHIYKRQQ